MAAPPARQRYRQAHTTRQGALVDLVCADPRSSCHGAAQVTVIGFEKQLQLDSCLFDDIIISLVLRLKGTEADLVKFLISALSAGTTRIFRTDDLSRNQKSLVCQSLQWLIASYMAGVNHHAFAAKSLEELIAGTYTRMFETICEPNLSVHVAIGISQLE